VILRCTKKLVDVVGPKRIAEPAPAPDVEDWYGNLLWFERRKCLLLTHAGTLFTIFEPNITAADLRSTHRLVVGLIERELGSEDLPPGAFGDLASEDLLIAKTADCSVVGCMLDMAFLCKVVIGRSGGLAAVDVADLNRSCGATSTVRAAMSARSNSSGHGSKAGERLRRSGHWADRR
jgi:hypothetical protein